MKYETTQTGWVSGEECNVGKTHTYYTIQGQVLYLILTNEEERKTRGRNINLKQIKLQTTTTILLGWGIFLHKSLADPTHPPNGVWLWRENSLSLCLSSSLKFLSTLGEKMLVFMGTSCMFQIRGWPSTVHHTRLSGCQEIILCSPQYWRWWWRWSPRSYPQGYCTNTSFNYAKKILKTEN